MSGVHSKTTEEGSRERNSHELYWNDLDKGKFLGLLATSSLVLRACFHPMAVVKTRLQTTDRVGLSTFQIAKEVWKNEGFRRGFYRGFPVSLCALAFEPVYMGTLEMTRTVLSNHRPSPISSSQWDMLTSASSGCAAALVQQTFLVPIDVTTQRVMVTRARDGIAVRDVLRDIYSRSGDGIGGFYKGYLVTLAIALPFNSIIWTLYWRIQARLERLIPREQDQLVAPLSATFASLLTSLITQPIDVLKTRLQVAPKRQSLWRTFLFLIRERGFRGLFSGSFPRAMIVVPNSVIMMSLYEIIKRASAKPLSQ